MIYIALSILACIGVLLMFTSSGCSGDCGQGRFPCNCRSEK